MRPTDVNQPHQHLMTRVRKLLHKLRDLLTFRKLNHSLGTTGVNFDQDN